MEPPVVCSHRQLASMVTLVETDVHFPAAEHDCMGIEGWVSVVKVPTCCAEALAARRESRAVLENIATVGKTVTEL